MSSENKKNYFMLYPISIDRAAYWVVAAYDLNPIAEPERLALQIKDKLAEWEARARIYVGRDGLNIQMSIAAMHGPALKQWLADIGYGAMPLKLQGSSEHVFPRLTVKHKEQLVAIDRPVDLSKRGQHITPEEWRAALQQEEAPVVLDVRNHYEWEVGHFVGSRPAPCDSFREFPQWAKALKQEVGTERPVLMCCTGGIRCEFFSALLKEEGFEDVRQLDGGILAYSERCGDELWEGSLFVFDDRLTVAMGENEKPVGSCLHCGVSTTSYLNCANMDCNKLFLCCQSCVCQQQGCCCSECQHAPRLRLLPRDNPFKPFARAHLEVQLAQQ